MGLKLFGKNQKPEPAEEIIVQCRVSKIGQKQVTIPKKAKIEDGDYVRIIKLETINGTQD